MKIRKGVFDATYRSLECFWAQLPLRLPVGDGAVGNVGKSEPTPG